MTIVLNQQQKNAVDMAMETAQSPGKRAVLSGPAGTGKTVSLKEICTQLPGSLILTPTGRASLRVKEATGFPAKTIHSWLYMPVIDPKTGQIIRFDRRTPESVVRPSSNLLIIDESSMITREVWSDIDYVCRIMNISILIVGDSFQLPPVQKDEDEAPFSVFLESFETDFRVDLVEVHRQALDSPVLRAATNIRQMTSWGEVISELEDFEVIDGIKEGASRLHESKKNQIDSTAISFTNATRHSLNRHVRKLNQIDPDSDPLQGEPLLIRRNSPQTGVFNGEITEFTGFSSTPNMKGNRFGLTRINNVHCFLAPNEILGEPAPEYQLTTLASKVYKMPYVSANLGYCLTGHSGQGSEWNEVYMILEQKLVKVLSTENRIRWTYTVLTRARSNVVICTVAN